jgi:hypothetical protein
MPVKLMTIVVRVEPPAFGPVILKLKEMPGVVEFSFDGSDSKASREDNGSVAAPRANGEEIVTALLIKGPAHIRDVMRALAMSGLSGTKPQAYGVMHQLRRKKVAKSTGNGVIELTERARKSIAGHEDTALRLLPRPKGKAKKPNGETHRNPAGLGRKLFLTALLQGPARMAELKQRLEGGGVTNKSLSGIQARARRDGLAKLKDGLYDLTAKGKSEAQAPEEVAHG